MTYALGAKSLERLAGVHPDLVRTVKLAIQKTTQDFTVTEGLRTKARQVYLVQTGKSKTMNSRHITELKFGLRGGKDGFSADVERDDDKPAATVTTTTTTEIQTPEKP